MTTRSEIDDIEVPFPVPGSASSNAGEPTVDAHGGHAFLYLPDLSSETGWAGHRVPDPTSTQPARQSIGFRPQRARRA